MKITIGIADDHRMFLDSLTILLNSIPPFEVIMGVVNGEEVLTRLRAGGPRPDILLLDVAMPVLNGLKTAQLVSKQYPDIKLMALSMKDDDNTVIGMLKAGCCAFLPKDAHANELEKALLEVHTKGYYNADADNPGHRRHKAESERAPEISPREREFLTHACSDLTYKEIAGLMYLSDRTIDGYRDSLFQKLNVKSRVGMALEALRRNLVDL